MGRQSKALIEVGGIRGMATSLQNLARSDAGADSDLDKKMKAATKAAAEKLVPYAKRAVPSRTGKLKETIRAEGTRRFARIKAGTPKKVPYARSVHSGRYFASSGKRTKGTPYIRRSIPQAFPEIIDEFVSAMNAVAKEFNRKYGAGIERQR